MNKGGRERFDDHIRADQVREGDELHLLFMGGDEYVTVRRTRKTELGRIQLAMGSSVVREIHNTIQPDKMVWIKKRTA